MVQFQLAIIKGKEGFLIAQSSKGNQTITGTITKCSGVTTREGNDISSRYVGVTCKMWFGKEEAVQTIISKAEEWCITEGDNRVGLNFEVSSLGKPEPITNTQTNADYLVVLVPGDKAKFQGCDEAAEVLSDTDVASLDAAATNASQRLAAYNASKAQPERSGLRSQIKRLFAPTPKPQAAPVKR